MPVAAVPVAITARTWTGNQPTGTFENSTGVPRPPLLLSLAAIIVRLPETPIYSDFAYEPPGPIATATVSLGVMADAKRAAPLTFVRPRKFSFVASYSGLP